MRKLDVISRFSADNIQFLDISRLGDGGGKSLNGTRPYLAV
jgi:hypothetical protein